MSKLNLFLTGTEVLAKAHSPFNGELTVVRDLAWGTHIKGGGLTQSGGVAYTIWNTTLKNVAKGGERKKVLILGLGGGSIARITNRLWPDAKVRGVDIDPVIVELGSKYLKLPRAIDVVISDVTAFLKKDTDAYDLICVDLYQGDTYPAEFETEVFVRTIKKHLSPTGIAVFNRLYYGDKRSLAYKFQKTLEQNFSDVSPVYPEANIMFVVSL